MTSARREFLKSSVAVTAAALTTISSVQADEADNAILRIGLIGCGGMGSVNIHRQINPRKANSSFSNNEFGPLMCRKATKTVPRFTAPKAC